LRSFRLAALFVAVLGFAVAAGAVLADTPKVTVLGVSDGRLRQQIEQAVGASKAAPQSRFEARRRAESAAADVIAVLRSEGYYEYAVEPDVGTGDQPQSVVKVTPGPRFTMAEPQIVWDGSPPAREAMLAGASSIGLTIGAPGRAADVLAAEGRIVAAIAKRGYADAKVEPRQVVVDHATRTVQATFHIQSGPLVALDGVKINSPGRTRQSYINRVLPWRAGAVYDPEDVAELERRLRAAGVYDAVSVALAPPDQALPDGRRPVVVSLTDKPKSTLELGASYSTAEGSGVDGRWIVYNRLGLADTITFDAQIANILSKGEIDLALPDFSRAGQTLKLSGSVYKDDTSAYLENGARIATDLQRHFGKSDLGDIGLSLDVSRDQEPNVINDVLVTQYRRLITVTALFSATLDHSDDLLNPKRGWRVSVTAEPTASFGDGPIDYIRTQAQISAYWPFDPNGFTDLAGRVHIGSIIAGSIPGVPASRRFYEGGGGSVRGYAYQQVGPRFPNNSPEGGLSMLETSAELRQQVYGPWAVAAFVDSGVLGTRQSFDLSTVETGVGLGVRYNLGFAPFRVDFAVPLEKRPGDAAFQIYLSIGQSF
jgi:translocation and assembly module TamA